MTLRFRHVKKTLSIGKTECVHDIKCHDYYYSRQLSKCLSLLLLSVRYAGLKERLPCYNYKTAFYFKLLSAFPLVKLKPFQSKKSRLVFFQSISCVI